MYFCSNRTLANNETRQNIYETMLVFANHEYVIDEKLGSKKPEKIEINFQCNKNVFIDTLCLGTNDISWKTNKMSSKSLCLDEDIINYCFLNTYNRFNISEFNKYNLILTNLNDIHDGLDKIANTRFKFHQVYDNNIDKICDNIRLEPVEKNSDCKCFAREWNKQSITNNNVLLVGFEADIDEVEINPSKCVKKVE